MLVSVLVCMDAYVEEFGAAQVEVLENSVAIVGSGSKERLRKESIESVRVDDPDEPESPDYSDGLFLLAVGLFLAFIGVGVGGDVGVFVAVIGGFTAMVSGLWMVLRVAMYEEPELFHKVRFRMCSGEEIVCKVSEDEDMSVLNELM